MKHIERRRKLLAWLRANRQRPFRPGRWDCALFAAGAIKAMTGVDHARGLRGKYSTIDKGKAILRAMGHEDHIGLVATLYAEIPISQAQVGDIAVVMDGDNAALGIVQGERIYVLRTDGLATVELTDAVKAFRIP